MTQGAVMATARDRPAAAGFNWALAGPLLECPHCRRPALRAEGAAIVCEGCARIYPITDGVLDFVGDAPAPARPFYADPAYHRFIEGIEKIHAAHYRDGSASDALEQALKRDLFSLVEPFEGPAVELGCGIGQSFAYLGNPDAVIGVDLEMDLLRETRRRHPRATLIRADFANLPFRTGALKTVFAIAVLEHVFLLERALEHMQRALSGDGRCYVAVPTEGGLAVGLARRVTSARNAKLLGLTPAQCRRAQEKDHCNTVFAIDGALRKFFAVDAATHWPFRLGGAHLNLSANFRLRQIVPQ